MSTKDIPLTEWWRRIEARDRAEAEASNRYVEQMKALQRERQERENRERVAAWEASQARERAEKERAAEEHAKIRREMTERKREAAAQPPLRQETEQEIAERMRALGMPAGWRPPVLK
jgi:hypothetical protein